MLVALAAIPVLLRGLGTERFGVLALAWVTIGYFSLFDFGLGRALTQVLAEKLGTREEADIPAVTWTALLLMVILGILGGVLLAVLSPWLTQKALNIPGALQSEALHTFYLLAFSLPWVLSTAALRGILEAQQRFGLVNAVRVPMGLLTYLGPLAVLPFSSSLVPVVGVMVAGRVIAWLVHALLCLRTMPLLRQRIAVERRAMVPLVRFGSWMTVSNLVSPLMVYLDRFLIGALLSMAAVAFYVTPYEVVTRLWLVPGALLAVLFPAFATSFAHDRARTARLFERGLKTVFLVMFPATLILVLLAPEGLALWLGGEFARNSARVLQWLAAGVFINSVGQVPFSVVQGVGRPDLTGKLHLIELPLYLAALWWLLGRYGIEGAAIAWTVRVAADTMVLSLVAGRLLPESVPALRRGTAVITGALVILGFAAVQEGIGAKMAYLVVALASFGLAGWYGVLAPEERALIRRRPDVASEMVGSP